MKHYFLCKIQPKATLHFFNQLHNVIITWRKHGEGYIPLNDDTNN